MLAAFSHEDLQAKRQFLSLAREHLDKSREDSEAALAYELSAALLYMNIADYLAEYLVKGVASLSSQAVSEYYHGVIEIGDTKIKDLNIGSSIYELKKYNFPRKDEILSKLAEVNVARIKVAHKILKIKPDELETIDDAIRKLQDNTEDLISMVDQVQLGMPPKTLRETLGAEQE